MASKMVEVLCPNGRRAKIKTTPAMTVLEILQQTCEKHGFQASEYDLKHQKKVLNVTSVTKYLNLTNNAKLEMVKLSKPRPESKPIIALQLEDGTRDSAEFSTDATLIEILTHFQDNWKVDLITPNIVCLYTGIEYKTNEVLQKTTLRSMGISSGRAMIRIHYRDDIEDVSASTEVSSNETTTTATTTTITTTTIVISDGNEPNGKKRRLNGNLSKDASSSDNTTTERLPTVLPTPRLGPDQLFLHAPPKSIFPQNAEPSTSIFPVDHQASNTGHSVALPEAQRSNETLEFANFKFPEKKDDEDDEFVIDPVAMRTEVELSMPCDRETALYVPDVSQNTAQRDEGDNFFDVTVEDVRRRLQILTSAKKNVEETALLTKSMRQKKELEKVAAFEKVPIRFHLPNNHILQAIFRPLETVKSLKEFLLSYTHEDIKQVEIFTTPPKLILKDNKQTLYKAKLCPAALVYVTGLSTEFILKKEHLDNVKTQAEARSILENCIGKRRTRDQDGNDSTNQEEPSTSNEQYELNRTMRTSNENKKYDAKPAGAPKWFKTKR